MNIYKEVIFNEFLHTCPLYKTTMMNAWCCDGRRIKNNGCVKNGIDDITVLPNTISWRCQECDFDLCYDCIKKYIKVANDLSFLP